MKTPGEEFCDKFNKSWKQFAISRAWAELSKYPNREERNRHVEEVARKYGVSPEALTD